MESLDSLKARKNDLEQELESKRHGSTHWRPGVTYQFKSNHHILVERPY